MAKPGTLHLKGGAVMRRGLAAAAVLALLLWSAAAHGLGEGGWYYRVVARNDTPQAQAEKLLAREKILAACPCREGDLLRALPAIQRAAEAFSPCQTALRLWAPEGLPPRPTLEITLGEGRGHNCWGVLYADSLLLARAEGAPNPGEPVEFVWPLWEWLLGLLGL